MSFGHPKPSGHPNLYESGQQPEKNCVFWLFFLCFEKETKN